jgi:hypothetical protein
MAALIGLALALPFTPAIANAQQKGAEKLIQLTTIKTAEDLQKIEPGDLIVMSCPKCKESWATVAEQTFKGARPQDLKTVQVHLCSKCDTKIETKGQGKQAKDVLVHSCNACGSKDVFCCVIKKGSLPTPGMSEQK